MDKCMLSTQDALDPGLPSMQRAITVLDGLDGEFDFPEVDDSVERLLAELAEGRVVDGAPFFKRSDFPVISTVLSKRCWLKSTRKRPLKKLGRRIRVCQDRRRLPSFRDRAVECTAPRRTKRQYRRELRVECPRRRSIRLTHHQYLWLGLRYACRYIYLESYIPEGF